MKKESFKDKVKEIKEKSLKKHVTPKTKIKKTKEKEEMTSEAKILRSGWNTKINSFKKPEQIREVFNDMLDKHKNTVPKITDKVRAKENDIEYLESLLENVSKLGAEIKKFKEKLSKIIEDRK